MPGPAYPPLTAPAGKMVDDMAFKPLRICVMTISDTRTDETDTSGHLLAERVKESGHGSEGGIEGLNAYLSAKFVSHLG